VRLVPPAERGEEPARDSSERDLLLSWLDWHRATMAIKCEGLTAAQLGQRSCPPSELTLLGLVRHLTEIERNYLAAWAGIADLPHYYSDEDPDGDFHLPDPVTDEVVRQAFDAWRAESDRSRHIVTEADSLDQPNAKGSPLRWVVVYVLREYARHNGHADLLREAIDGATGE
jgi:Protein of unknown function (DUF664)